MENDDEHFSSYLEANNRFYQQQPNEFDLWVDEAISAGDYDSSSPDGAAFSAASKNKLSEQNRRKKLSEKLYALRAVVPNISKMDRASILKDAIEYIQELHEQERRVQAEIMELEGGKMMSGSGGVNYDGEMAAGDVFGVELPLYLRSKKKRIERQQMGYDSCSGGSRFAPIEDLELRVTSMADDNGIVVVNLTCIKRTDTMVKLCEVFESLKLNVITATITTFSGRLSKTVVLKADEDEAEQLRAKIERGIAALSDPQSPMSM